MASRAGLEARPGQAGERVGGEKRGWQQGKRRVAMSAHYGRQAAGGTSGADRNDLQGVCVTREGLGVCWARQRDGVGSLVAAPVVDMPLSFVLLRIPDVYRFCTPETCAWAAAVVPSCARVMLHDAYSRVS